MNLGGLENLIVCTIIGGIFGILFRDKTKSKWIGLIIGIFGAIISTFLLSYLVNISFVGVIIYSIFGSWIFNLVFKKLPN